MLDLTNKSLEEGGFINGEEFKNRISAAVIKFGNRNIHILSVYAPNVDRFYTEDSGSNNGGLNCRVDAIILSYVKIGSVSKFTVAEEP
ncbi:uncharacterized protein KGF55_002756 [Candida pseudojiufengensis]|uniref:uncharacterized protein n=1 Tax=Candida pseudojiufengensis TaxID=497109 RepID=UPI00222490FD|nr:uncharacterized protein KGF55_002756 [Candida pseudojiufengensis]KAI5962964.1 hypothetical protein KGF55_002756 [Candida pseudojiufengensis]